MTRFFARLALVLLLASVAVSRAEAHAFLDRSNPAVGSTLKTAPAEVRIWFTEALEPAFSRIAVTNEGGGNVTAGRATIDPKDPKLLEVKLRPLPPGTYRVEWRVVSVDTHPTQGDFAFTVAP
jgi:copper resistance protein C